MNRRPRTDPRLEAIQVRKTWRGVMLAAFSGPVVYHVLSVGADLGLWSHHLFGSWWTLTWIIFFLMSVGGSIKAALLTAKGVGSAELRLLVTTLSFVRAMYTFYLFPGV